MQREKQHGSATSVGIVRKMSLLAACGALALPLTSVGQVERTTIDFEDGVAPAEIQAVIVSCLGEEVWFTGTVAIITMDGAPPHYNWLGVTAYTLDGDLFVGGSGVGGNQSNLTLVEVGAGQDARQIHIRIVDGALSFVCH